MCFATFIFKNSLRSFFHCRGIRQISVIILYIFVTDITECCAFFCGLPWQSLVQAQSLPHNPHSVWLIASRKRKAPDTGRRFLLFLYFLWHAPAQAQWEQLLPQEDLPCFFPLTMKKIIAATMIASIKHITIVPMFCDNHDIS